MFHKLNIRIPSLHFPYVQIGQNHLHSVLSCFGGGIVGAEWEIQNTMLFGANTLRSTRKNSEANVLKFSWEGPETGYET